MSGIFGVSFGVAVGDGARAMSAEQIAEMQRRCLHDMRQAAPDLDFTKYMNWQPPQRPLDERFADFKVRLAAAIERRRVG